ncbi:hypothetical protein BT63DRAFT_365415, partial [Microthyrium microscopicum]
GSFKYKSKIPVHNAETLKAFLQKRKHSVGLKFDDIKDGWQDAQVHCDEMETKHELLVVRDKRGVIRSVWQDDPSLWHNIGDDLRRDWNAIRLPKNQDELREKLLAADITPSSEKVVVERKVGRKDNRKRSRRGGKQTNTHIAHLLKDYSH